MTRDDALIASGSRRRTASGYLKDRSHQPMRTLVAAALVAALPLASANAEIITLEYEATLPAGNLPNGKPGLPEDVVLIGRLTFDSEAADIRGLFNEARYLMLEHTVTLNGIPFSMNDLAYGGFGPDGLYNQIFVLNNYFDSADHFRAISYTEGEFYGFEMLAFELTLHDESGTLLTSTELPAAVDQLDAFTLKQAGIRWFDGSFAGGFAWVDGSLTRLEVLSDSAPLAVECEGFAPPFDAPIGLGKREQRVIPLRMEIFDEGGFPLGPNDIAAPTVSVSFSVGAGSEELGQLVDSTGNATPDARSWPRAARWPWRDRRPWP
jgi:hypothetical protein